MPFVTYLYAFLIKYQSINFTRASTSTDWIRDLNPELIQESLLAALLRFSSKESDEILEFYPSSYSNRGCTACLRTRIETENTDWLPLLMGWRNCDPGYNEFWPNLWIWYGLVGFILYKMVWALRIFFWNIQETGFRHGIINLNEKVTLQSLSISLWRYKAVVSSRKNSSNRLFWRRSWWRGYFARNLLSEAI